MKLDITTPALLFPTVSLLMLAYTNRFLALASVIRQLYSEYRASPDTTYLKQIASLRQRIKWVRNMQFFGVLSLLLCTLCVFAVFFDALIGATALFCASVLSMVVSLIYSLLEIRLSVKAIDLHLCDVENEIAARERN